MIQIKQTIALNELGKRANQQDNIYPAKGKAGNNDRFFLVCDGMGGHLNGEIASQSVCQSFAAFLQTVPPEKFDKTVFEQTLRFSYKELDKRENENPSGNNMGTTLTFIYFTPETAFMAHIGDSRIYHIRKENGQAMILYQSQDHSYVNDLVRAGIISPEEARIHPKRNIITRAMQPYDERYEASIYETKNLIPGDLFFLCSDGILEQIDNARLCNILEQNTDVETMMAQIKQICSDWSSDNFSAYLIEI